MAPPTTVLFVPGVGLWPELFAETVAHLDLGSTVTTDIVVRPTDRLDIDAQVDFLAERCAQVGPAVIVGVSGGATLALACAIKKIDCLVAVISHEPLVGALESELNDRVAEAGRRLRANPSEEIAMAFVAGLYGPAWQHVPRSASNWARSKHEVICAEVGEFAAFQPAETDLRLAVPHLTTVGARSAPERHRVAELLAGHGAETATIEHSGHLVLTEGPASFAVAIGPFIHSVAGGSP